MIYIWLLVLLLSVFSFSKAEDNQYEFLLQTVSQLAREIDLVKQKTSQLEKDHEVQIAALNEKIDKQNGRMNFIGFTAYSTVELELHEGDIAVFNTVETNVGGGYNTATGMFTCPTTGLYFFGTASYSNPDTIVEMRLVKEEVGVIGSLADVAGADQGANFWVVECTAGEKVWCEQNRPGGYLGVGYGEDVVLNSFVGFLIGITA